ncbi:MAG: hypothetical protein AAF707_01350 [Pseudomonadota bacterium]
MKHALAIIVAAGLAGGLAVAPTAVEANPNKGSSSAKAKGKTSTAKSTTKSSARKTRPGYTRKKTKRKPARTAASVINERARNEASKKSKTQGYKTTRKRRAKRSAAKTMGGGQPATSIAAGAKPGAFTRLTNWFGSLFGSKPKAKARKKRPQTVASSVMPRLQKVGDTYVERPNS